MFCSLWMLLLLLERVSTWRAVSCALSSAGHMTLADAAAAWLCSSATRRSSRLGPSWTSRSSTEDGSSSPRPWTSRYTDFTTRWIQDERHDAHALAKRPVFCFISQPYTQHTLSVYSLTYCDGCFWLLLLAKMRKGHTFVCVEHTVRNIDNNNNNDIYDL